MPIFPFKKEEKEEIPKPPEKEVIAPPEIKPEVEKEKEVKIEKVAEVPTAVPPTVAVPPVPPAPPEVIAPPKIEKSPTLIEIEKILSEDIDKLYASLAPEQKLIFKKKGEETASKIEILIQEVKINVKKILSSIKEWLFMLIKMIPGVNRFFLIQESKIKTTKILNLRNAKIVKNLKRSE